MKKKTYLATLNDIEKIGSKNISELKTLEYPIRFDKEIVTNKNVITSSKIGLTDWVSNFKIEYGKNISVLYSSNVRKLNTSSYLSYNYFILDKKSGNVLCGYLDGYIKKVVSDGNNIFFFLCENNGIFYLYKIDSSMEDLEPELVYEFYGTENTNSRVLKYQIYYEKEEEGCIINEPLDYLSKSTEKKVFDVNLYYYNGNFYLYKIYTQTCLLYHNKDFDYSTVDFENCYIMEIKLLNEYANCMLQFIYRSDGFNPPVDDGGEVNDRYIHPIRKYKNDGLDNSTYKLYNLEPYMRNNISDIASGKSGLKIFYYEQVQLKYNVETNSFDELCNAFNDETGINGIHNLSRDIFYNNIKNEYYFRYNKGNIYLRENFIYNFCIEDYNAFIQETEIGRIDSVQLPSTDLYIPYVPIRYIKYYRGEYLYDRKPYLLLGNKVIFEFPEENGCITRLDTNGENTIVFVYCNHKDSADSDHNPELIEEHNCLDNYIINGNYYGNDGYYYNFSIYVSTDSGITWKKINIPLTYSHYGVDVNYNTYTEEFVYTNIYKRTYTGSPTTAPTGSTNNETEQCEIMIDNKISLSMETNNLLSIKKLLVENYIVDDIVTLDGTKKSATEIQFNLSTILSNPSNYNVNNFKVQLKNLNMTAGNQQTILTKEYNNETGILSIKSTETLFNGNCNGLIWILKNVYNK